MFNNVVHFKTIDSKTDRVVAVFYENGEEVGRVQATKTYCTDLAQKRYGNNFTVQEG